VWIAYWALNHGSQVWFLVQVEPSLQQHLHRFWIAMINEWGQPIELPSLWGIRVQAKSLLVTHSGKHRITRLRRPFSAYLWHRSGYKRRWRVSITHIEFYYHGNTDLCLHTLRWHISDQRLVFLYRLHISPSQLSKNFYSDTIWCGSQLHHKLLIISFNGRSLFELLETCMNYSFIH